MTQEHKSIDLARFKMLDDDPGGFEGYVSVFGELDDVGDIVLEGAYKKTLPAFLKRGFGADSHIWRFGDLLGYPTDAYEDRKGFYVKQQFHSTPDAQSVRTKAQERMAAGKQVSFSIGYDLNAPPVFITRAEFETELPKYVKPELLPEAIQKAQKFPEIRLLTGIELFESSIVTVPALQSAMATGVKGILQAGMPLDEHSEVVQAAASGYVSRVRDLLSLRSKDRKEGRVLSTTNMSRLTEVADALQKASGDIRQILKDAQPRQSEDDAKEWRNAILKTAELHRLYGRFSRS